MEVQLYYLYYLWGEQNIFLALLLGTKQALFAHNGQRSNGVVVRVVACEARGPGFHSSSDQMVFFSPRVYGGRNKMDPDTINYVILRIHVDKNYNNNS